MTRVDKSVTGIPAVSSFGESGRARLTFDLRDGSRVIVHVDVTQARTLAARIRGMLALYEERS